MMSSFNVPLTSFDDYVRGFPSEKLQIAYFEYKKLISNNTRHLIYIP